ncbi:MAG: TRL-like family protein [Alphaproteobacteria bacterium]|nr:TRL-like family protein [Alphaproteobacteria bacterium]
MKKVITLSAAFALGACVYGNPANYERYYGNADISKVDWTKVDSRGSSCQTNFLGFIPVGSQSVPAAVKNGNLAKVAYVDTDTVVAFPLFVRECTNVWGEKSTEAQ